MFFIPFWILQIPQKWSWIQPLPTQSWLSLLQATVATYTDVRQDVPEHEGRIDTTFNVLSVQSWNSGHHYWEIDVGEKIYGELGLTYPSIPRKGQKEDCWLGCHSESWCLEYFDGDYTAWHGGTPHPLSILADFRRIGILCSFSGGLVTFVGVDNTTPLYSFCAGTFTDHLHLALFPGHDLQGTNSKLIQKSGSFNHKYLKNATWIMQADLTGYGDYFLR